MLPADDEFDDLAMDADADIIALTLLDHIQSLEPDCICLTWRSRSSLTR